MLLRVVNDLATSKKKMKNAISTNQKSALLFNEWPRTMAKTMVTAKKVISLSFPD